MCQKYKIIIFLTFIITSSLFGAKPYVVADSFYPTDKKELRTQVRSFLNEARLFKTKKVRAVIVPHAGYIYSGSTSTLAYKNLGKHYKNIFIIGSSHYESFNGASIYNIDNYSTPLGIIESNKKIISDLLNHSEFFSFQKNAHIKEHTVEVQLPFLQTIYDKNLKIIPILLGTHQTKTIRAIADILQPYFIDENLFIISSDLSHYPVYEDAIRVDKHTINSILQNNPNSFIDTLISNENNPQKGVQTLACGWSSILTLLYLTQTPTYHYELLGYKNSGDSRNGNKNRVVGYGAIRVYEEGFSLNNEEKKELLEIAKLALYEITLNHKTIQIDETLPAPKLKQKVGAFVTLHKNNRLRGCIGQFEPNEPLYKVVANMAIAAAQNDSRFPKVQKNELHNIEIEISVLTPRTPIYSIDELTLGVDGIYIQKGLKNGTFLPQVATDMHWNKEQFVGYCAQQKAKIGFYGYKNANLFKYQTIIFDKNSIK